VALVEPEKGTLNNLPEAALNVRAVAACLVWFAPRRRRGSATSSRSSSLERRLGEGGKGGKGSDAVSESDSLPAAGEPLQDAGRSDHPRITPAANIKAQLAKYCIFTKSETTAASATIEAAAVSPAEGQVLEQHGNKQNQLLLTFNLHGCAASWLRVRPLWNLERRSRQSTMLFANAMCDSERTRYYGQSVKPGCKNKQRRL
jgi:hypothetical protein